MSKQMPRFHAFGIYSKGEEPGTLVAEWARTDWVSGKTDQGAILTGLAKGGPLEGFCGTYVVRYANQDGELGESYDLIIRTAGDAYELVWKKAGKVLYTGVGTFLMGRLIFGWGPIAD